MYSVKHSQKISYPWGKLSIHVPTKFFPLLPSCAEAKTSSQLLLLLPIFLSTELEISAFWTDCSVAVFFPFHQEPSWVPELFHYIFCMLESCLHLALFCQREENPSFFLCKNKNYMSIKLKLLNGLKTLFSFLVQVVCFCTFIVSVLIFVPTFPWG